MRDVASLVGVSTQTVSRVINNRSEVTDATRDRVWAAIKELGYHPHSLARSLRTGVTRTIALLIPDIAVPEHGVQASAAEEAVEAHGYSLVVHSTHDNVGQEAAYLAAIVQRSFDGLLFVGAHRHTDVRMLEEAGIPCVAVDRVPERYAGPYVALDSRAAGRLAAGHLVGLGHRRIAYICSSSDLPFAEDQRAGITEAIAEQGAHLVLCRCDEVSPGLEAGYRAVSRVLAADPRPTAIIATADAVAIGALRGLTQAGLVVPNDISLVGINDIPFAAYQTPSLTSVRQPFKESISAGFDLLLDLIAGRQGMETHLVKPPALMVRESTAPPKGRP